MTSAVFELNDQHPKLNTLVYADNRLFPSRI